MDFVLKLIQDLNEPAHVRSLKMRGKVHIKVKLPYSILKSLGSVKNLDRVF
jgi:hypothetical protein